MVGYCEVGYCEEEVVFEPEVSFFFFELELEDLWPDFPDLEGFYFSRGVLFLGKFNT